MQMSWVTDPHFSFPSVLLPCCAVLTRQLFLVVVTAALHSVLTLLCLLTRRR